MIRFEELNPEDQKDVMLQLEYMNREFPKLRMRVKQLEDTLSIYADHKNWNKRDNFEFNTSPGWEMAERVMSPK